MNKIPITVIVSVKNEALNLPSCLEKLKRFAQIIVVDSGSSDDTLSIAAAMGAEVLQFVWDGKFPKNAIGHCRMQTLSTNGFYF